MALLLAFGSARGGVATVDHELSLRLIPATAEVEGHDRVTLPDGVDAAFTLAAGLTPKAAYPIQTLASDEPGLQRYEVRLPAGVRSFELEYSGRLRGLDDAVSGQHAVLDPEAGWYPRFGAVPVRFTLRVQLPEGWRSVSQGQAHWLAPSATQVWQARTPQLGIWLVAAPFHRYARASVWGEAQAWLRDSDPDLARQYLDATVDYLRLYSRLLGPYPYPKFALVENVQQTGWGMPSFTLLGSRVIRLPFIVHTSYPHEILHNWWGNGVWVAYEQGNWAEALTTYLADYLLAEQRGRGMNTRRAALQKYADFVAEHNDFPLSQFRARHSEASQAVGYSKGMYLFHMLRRQLGDRPFVQALRAFYQRNLFREASFADLQAVFEQVSGTSLEAEFSQWLHRTGAPELNLQDVTVTEQPQGYQVRLTLRQTQAEAAYRLYIPVAIQFAGQDTAEWRALRMSDKEQVFTWKFQRRPVRIAVDPAFDVFRRLHEGELPPSLGSVLGASQVWFVWPSSAEPAMQEAYRRLAEQWARPGDRVVSDRELGSLPQQPYWLLGADNRLLQAFQSREGQGTAPEAEGSVRLDGHDWSLQANSVVLAAQAREGAAGVWIAAPSPKAVAALARKLPHYSRYGYLVFSEPDTRNRLKGEWPASGSPLQRLLDQRDAERPLVLPPRAPLSALAGPGLHAPP